MRYEILNAYELKVENTWLRIQLEHAREEIRLMEAEWLERDLNDYACARALSEVPGASSGRQQMDGAQPQRPVLRPTAVRDGITD